MTISATLVAPSDALAALADAIAAAKGSDALAPVTVAVPTNTCGVMARRALGRSGGIAAVDMVTLNRLAELIAGPRLAAAGRSPVSVPVIDLTIAAILADDAGPFGPVAAHPSTVVALRELHQELRVAESAARDRLRAESLRGRHVLRVSDAVTATLERSWYDEADLLAVATTSLRDAVPTGLRSLILHLPQELSGLALDFVRAFGDVVPVRLIVQTTGSPDGDADSFAILDALGLDHGDPVALVGPLPRAIMSSTDADDEVRVAVRAVLDAARAGTPFERIAVLWPAQRPYARLVERHLSDAAIAWNGRAGTALVERLAPRLVLDLLDVDRRGLRRRSLFDLLADVPARDRDGNHLPTASWERVSREAGVSRDDDWDRRLGSIAGYEQWTSAATSLKSFVSDLRGELGHPSATRPWSQWATWCDEQVERWLGRLTLEHLPEAEYRAWESLTTALDRLRHLDSVGEPVTRHRFRSVLEAELAAIPPREGRVGNGVTVGPLAGAIGLDVDVTIVVGAAEGLLPPIPRSDPLLSDSDRALAGLATADAHAARLHRAFLATIATSTVTLTHPRGDLRATTQLLASRWIAPWIDELGVDEIASHHAGLEATEFPATTTEHRLRRRSQRSRSGQQISEGDDAPDAVLDSGLACVSERERHELTSHDGDLSGAAVPRLEGPVSPTRLESWVACPHAYFAHYLLDVDPIEEPGDEISITGRDRGSAHHSALDLFHRAVVDGTLPQPTHTGWTGEHRAALGAAFDEVSERTQRRGRTGRPAFWADERGRMKADLLTWLERDSAIVRERCSTVLASEMRFGRDDGVAIRLPDGRSVQLQGSVDRVDRMRDGTLVVTDHKTGGSGSFTDLSADDPTRTGTLFQLPSYAAAARSRFGNDDTIVLAEYGLMRKGNYARPGYLITPEVDERVRVALASVVAGIETGYFPNRPVRPGYHFFVSCEYCEPDGLGTAERWGEWERKHRDPRLSQWFGAPADEVDDTAETDGDA